MHDLSQFLAELKALKADGDYINYANEAKEQKKSERSELYLKWEAIFKIMDSKQFRNLTL
jgi:hypothetical protein